MNTVYLVQVLKIILCLTYTMLELSLNGIQLIKSL